MTGINTANRVKTDFFIGFYPQANFDFIDREPAKASLSTSTIKGFVKGVPKLGSAFYLAFVGEAVDCRWFGSSHQIDNWGDDGVYSASWTHTYTDPGFYWARVGNTSGAYAVRQVRVIYRTPPAFPATYTPFDINYPIAVDESTEGGIDTTFAMRFTIEVYGRIEQSAIASLEDRMGVCIFAQEWRDGSNYGNLKVVCGGWLTNPGGTLARNGNTFTFTSMGVCNWLNLAYMREQDYISPELQAMIMGADAVAAGTLNTDYLGQGYVPNHWIQCDAVVVACHVLQHVWVEFFDSPTNPPMYYGQEAEAHGMISQFLDVNTDSDFDEAAGLPGNKLQGFTVGEGNVLSNIRSTLLDNEGWRLYDRADVTMRLERKPWWRATQPAAALTLDDLQRAGDNLVLESGDQIKVRQVIINKPPDSYNLPTIDNTPVSGYSPSAPYDPIASYDTYDSSDCSSGGNPASGPALSPTASGWHSNNSDLMNQAADYASSTLNNASPSNPTNPFATFDPAKFMFKYPTPERTAGETITVNGIYSVDLEAWAKGYDKQRRARWQMSVPLLNSLSPDVGQLAEATYESGHPLDLEWVNKQFDIASIQIMIDPRGGVSKRQIILMEIDPDE